MRRRKFDHDEALRLSEAGLSYAKIGEALGVSHVAVFRVVRRGPQSERAARHAKGIPADLAPVLNGLDNEAYDYYRALRSNETGERAADDLMRAARYMARRAARQDAA